MMSECGDPDKQADALVVGQIDLPRKDLLTNITRRLPWSRGHHAIEHFILRKEKMDHKDRGANGKCLICSGNIKKIPSLTSKFLSRRAWGGDVEKSETCFCQNHKCRFVFHSRGLCAEEAEMYYSGYRDETYFVERNRYEPFYTRKHHDALEGDLGSKKRNADLENYLTSFGVFEKNDRMAVLDFGGGTGRLIATMPGNKYVFDFSGEDAAEGVTPLTKKEVNGRRFDLVVCAQMLEHVTDPLAMATNAFALVNPGGFFYVEVPDETWRDFSCNGFFRDILLSFAMKNNKFNIFLDFYGTGFRVKTGFLPPFGFVPVREHLNYFTAGALSLLSEEIGGEVVSATNRFSITNVKSHSIIIKKSRIND